MAEPWSMAVAKAEALDWSWRLRAEALVEQVAHLVARVDVNDHDWLSRAACAGQADASEVFFPTNPERRGIWERAAAICEACPVNLACLAAWLHERPVQDNWGYGGCTSPGDRADIRRAMARLDLRPTRPCQRCGQPLTGPGQRRYCSGACKTAAHRKRRVA